MILKKQCFSTGRHFCPPGDICQRLGTFLVMTSGEGAAIDILWVEAKDAAKRPAVHRTAPVFVS